MASWTFLQAGFQESTTDLLGGPELGDYIQTWYIQVHPQRLLLAATPLKTEAHPGASSVSLEDPSWVLSLPGSTQRGHVCVYTEHQPHEAQWVAFSPLFLNVKPLLSF